MKSLIEHTRFNDWFYLIPVPIAGFLFPFPPAYRGETIFLILLVSCFYLAQGYMINRSFEKETSKTSISLSLILLLSSSLLINLYIFSISLMGILIGLIYSWKLKHYFFSNILINGAGFALLVLIGYFSRGSGDYSEWWHLFIFSLLFSIPNQIIHIKAHKDTTHPLIDGELAFKATIIVSNILFASHLFYMIYLSKLDLALNKAVCLGSTVLFISTMITFSFMRTSTLQLRRIIRPPSLIYAGVIFGSYYL